MLRRTWIVGVLLCGVAWAGDSDRAEQMAVTEQLVPILEAVAPPLAGEGILPGVVVLPHKSAVGWWALKWDRPDVLNDALGAAVERLGTRWARVNAEREGTVREATPEALAKIATRAMARFVVLGRLEPTSGGRARVELSIFDETTSQLRQEIRVIDAPALSRNNPILLPFLFLLIAAGGTAFYFVRTRRGTIRVAVKRDMTAARATLVVRISESTAKPEVGDPAQFDAATRARGPQMTRFEQTMVTANSIDFRDIPVGQWYVHAFGVQLKDGVLSAFPECSPEIAHVSTKGTTQVRIDLAPDQLTYRVIVVDGPDGRPVSGAEISLEGTTTPSKTTNPKGEAMFTLSRGQHRVRVAAKGMQVSRDLEIGPAHKSDSMTIDLQRERTLGATKAAIEVPQGETSIDMSPPVIEYSNKGQATFGELVRGSAPMPEATPVAAPMWGYREASARDTMHELRGLSRYKAVSELGRGAMGVVYRARDMILERDVALKLVGEDVRQHPDALKMFLSEAKSLAALNHPNIVSVFDQGQDGRDTYMVMEFVEGRTVDALLKHYGKMSLPQTLQIAEQVCAGLAYAHERRILHRDIKPANIFVSKDGQVKIGDFGLARAIDQVRVKQTKVCGTPLYMSPEQIRGVDLDFRSDLYALGCSLYELLVGNPPFFTGEVLFHHMYTEPPAIRSLDANVPPEVAELVMACIAKEPDKRPLSAEALRAAFKPLLTRFGKDGDSSS